MQSHDKPEPTENAVPDEDQVDAADAVEQDAADQSDDAAPDLAAELAETKDRLLRALAEAENVRRRAQRDVENATKRSIAGFAREMVVVADNLDRALAAVDGKAVDGNDAVKGLLEGVSMTAREMLNAFERNGIKKLEPLGERFDPQQHEAMFEYEDASKPAGSVGQILEPGYILNGLPLRPAKVGVTKGGPKPGDAPAPSAQILDAAEAEKKAASGGTAYEDHGKAPGGNLDEEL